MNYITNEEGEVKVRHENGNEKWIPKHLAENKFLMKGQGLTAVEAPKKFEPELVGLDESKKDEFSDVKFETTKTIEEKSKGGRPSKTK